MRILIVTATDMEIAPLAARLRPVYRNDLTAFPVYRNALTAILDTSERGPRLKSYARAGHAVDILTTGVGMVATAVWCSHVLARNPYDLGLNVGVCGSFDPALIPGTAVHVVSDRIAELGAEDGDAFLTVQELHLLGGNEFPFNDGRLVNPAPPPNVAVDRLPAVAGITVNTVHGNDVSVAEVTRRFQPQVESMEGAAFMYACLVHDLAFAQVRAVSNVVERRNREAWKIAEAVQTLGRTALEILDHT